MTGRAIMYLARKLYTPNFERKPYLIVIRYHSISLEGFFAFEELTLIICPECTNSFQESLRTHAYNTTTQNLPMPLKITLALLPQ